MLSKVNIKTKQKKINLKQKLYLGAWICDQIEALSFRYGYPTLC